MSWCEASEFEKCFVVLDDYHLASARVDPSALLAQLCPSRAKQSCKRLVLALIVDASAAASRSLWSAAASGTEVQSLEELVAQAGSEAATRALLAGLRDALKLEFNARGMLAVAESSLKAKVAGLVVPRPGPDALVHILHSYFDEAIAPAVKQTHGQSFRVKASAAAIAGVRRAATESAFGLRDFLRWYGAQTYSIVTTQPCSNCIPRDITLIYNERCV